MNTKSTRRWVVGAVAAFAALSLAACSGGSSGSDDTKGSGGSGTITVGFSQLGAESGWRTANTESVKAAFTKDKGFDLTFVDAQQKQENQIKAIRDFIDQGVDAIAFSPVVETGWDQVLQEAKDAEIPVVLVDRTVKTSVSDPYATYIGNDFTKEGETAVAWIKKNAADAKIFELQGTLGSSAQVDREKPVDAELGSQIVGKASGNFTRAEGKAATEAALQAYPDMTMIVSHNDDMALGAIEAIEAAGKKPGTDIKIVSFDGVRDGLQALHDKKINYVVECNPVYGDQIADLVKKVVGGEDVPTRTIVPDEAFDQTITQETIDARKY
ncbi:ABC transporter substrate-binding protein [Luteimicrobium sp. NPDC057192]|uniref:ABC transporter substrate-binding protein n=1 Tax=Luteimicrobium sp. NPDC057192 TaxID=3346042 RepID=UPI00362F1730